MKNYQVFILLLLSSFTGYSCGFYPYGEDVRYCFFRPEFFNMYKYSGFDYNSNYFEPGKVYRENDIEPNDELWYIYCKAEVPVAAIHSALYDIAVRDFNKQSRNEMLKYLYRIKDYAALDYLLFAKKCEVLNGFYDDPWERNEYAALPQRNKLISEAKSRAKSVTNRQLSLRYTFLAIRLGYYNQDKNEIISLYNTVFANIEDKDIITYYSLYFRTLVEDDKAAASFLAAQVFANAPEKRFMVSQSFDTSIPLEQILEFTKTPVEKANVYALAAIKTPDRALDKIVQVYKNNPFTDVLPFLILREVNKLEDWIYTPYYTLFSPGVTLGPDDYTSLNIIDSRISRDRAYAAEVLDFVASINNSATTDYYFLNAAKAQLQFTAKQYTGCLETIKKFRKSEIPNTLYNELQLIKALAITSLQLPGGAIIPDEIKSIILKNQKNQKFLFALGRELEYKGNTSDAALLYSKLNNGQQYEEGDDLFDNAAYWQARRKGRSDNYEDFYTNYFSYINTIYTPYQLTLLIDDIKNNTATDGFSEWKYSYLKTRIPKLYDLLGTKYMRQDNLDMALNNFKNVPYGYWQQNYSLWERNEDESYGNEFDKNPFYQIKYTPDFIPIRDNISLNKYNMTKQLIDYSNKANDVNEQNRDYYYFLVANCYYNMTHYGNSWMMKRFFWTTNYYITPLEDEAEFKQSNFSKKYYLEAFKHAKTKKFKALCLRMAALCDSNRLNYALIDDFGATPDVSIYYKQLKKQFPEYYQELTGNCTAFADYFKARR